VTDFLAAVSVGIVDGVEMLDLCYMEDSNAATDMNVVMTSKGELLRFRLPVSNYLSKRAV